MRDYALEWGAAKYILYNPDKRHFFGAEVFNDGSAAFYPSHKRHKCWSFLGPDLGRIARKWAVFRVEVASQEHEAADADVVGGAAGALVVADVMQCVEDACPIPMASLCEIRACSSGLHVLIGDLQGRFRELRKNILRHLRRALNGHLLPPRFMHRTVPRVTWDLYFCEGLAALHFPPAPFYGEGLDGTRSFANAWRWRNKADEAVIDYLAKHATRERHYSQWHHSAAEAGEWRRQSARALEVLAGPVRVFLCFEETVQLQDLGEIVAKNSCTRWRVNGSDI